MLSTFWGRCFGERKICIWRINRPLIHRLLCPFSGDERTEELLLYMKKGGVGYQYSHSKYMLMLFACSGDLRSPPYSHKLTHIKM